ncbi:ethanolamine kinase 2 [Diaphorina citri]|uniref:ethanolamine kinase n=1 Tax=Diaphorina citri TaxID=121845 RepID=A0A3Q0J1B5_DIACI|nr:ethanolamine kinase 2 [Diaphorina citri]
MDDILIIESTVSHDSLEDDAYDVIKHVKPEWSRTDVQFKHVCDIIFHFSHFRFQALFPGGVSQLQSDWQYIETALSKTKSPVVFCHNDLLLGNIIYDETEDKVTFIDYEYAGVNYQAFDIANHFDEFAGVSPIDHSRYPGPEFQLSWLRTYLEEYTGSPPSPHQLATLHWQVQQFSPVAHCFWTIWGLVQAEHSDIEFDFFQYASSTYQGYVLKRDKYLGTSPPSPQVIPPSPPPAS